MSDSPLLSSDPIPANPLPSTSPPPPLANLEGGLLRPPGAGGGGLKKGKPAETFFPLAPVLGGGSSAGATGLGGAGHLLPFEAEASDKRLIVGV
jgi:hypothetical protein